MAKWYHLVSRCTAPHTEPPGQGAAIAPVLSWPLLPRVFIWTSPSAPHQQLLLRTAPSEGT